MSRSAVSACLESINSVGPCGADERLEVLLARDIEPPVEQARYILFDRNVFEYADIRFGFDLDHDADIAAGTIIPRLAPCGLHGQATSACASSATRSSACSIQNDRRIVAPQH